MKPPKGWEEVTLKDICMIKKGQSITSKSISPGNIPVIAGGQQPAYYHNKSNYTGNTITVSASGAYAGYINYFTIPIFASDCTAITSLDDKKTLLKYVYYILKSQQRRIYDFQKGGGQPHVYPRDLMDFKIILPPISTQKKIVSILEETEQAKEWQKEAYDLTKDFLKAVFLDMFGDPMKNPKKWPVTTIEQVAISKKGAIRMGPFGSQLKKQELVKEGVKVLWIENIVENKFNPAGIKYITEEKYEQLKGFTVKPGDIIITMMGTIGRVEIVPNIGKSIISSHLLKIELNNKICNAVYLKNIIMMPFVQNQFKEASHGAVMSGLNGGIIKSTKIPLPPLSLQQKFASIVKEVEQIKLQQKHSKEHLDNLFNNLMQKTFRGELTC